MSPLILNSTPLDSVTIYIAYSVKLCFIRSYDICASKTTYVHVLLLNYISTNLELASPLVVMCSSSARSIHRIATTPGIRSAIKATAPPFVKD
jgi:predicted metallopeptidase